MPEVTTGSSKRGASSQARYAAVDAQSRQQIAGSWIRIKVTDVASGVVQLETRLPANFLDGLEWMIPSVAGVDLKQLLGDVDLSGAVGGGGDGSRLVLDTHQGGQHIQIFLDKQA